MNNVSTTAVQSTHTDPMQTAVQSARTRFSSLHTPTARAQLSAHHQSSKSCTGAHRRSTMPPLAGDGTLPFTTPAAVCRAPFALSYAHLAISGVVEVGGVTMKPPGF